MFNESDIVYVYTREQAIADGLLVDVTETAREAGFKFPVVVTHAVWDEYIEWSDEDSQRQTYRDTEGRLWDVLYMLKIALQRLSGPSDTIHYGLYVVPRGGKAIRPKKIILKALCHPGDNGETVITVMKPNED